MRPYESIHRSHPVYFDRRHARVWRLEILLFLAGSIYQIPSTHWVAVSWGSHVGVSCRWFLVPWNSRECLPESEWVHTRTLDHFAWTPQKPSCVHTILYRFVTLQSVIVFHYSITSFSFHNSVCSIVSGPYGCVGKQLALLSLRTVIASLVHHFDIKFADGETGEGLLYDTRDVFTLELAPLNLVFTRRERWGIISVINIRFVPRIISICFISVF